MKIKLNNQGAQPTEEELDMQAFERDVALFSYLDRVEKGQLTPKEKKEREEFLKTIFKDKQQ